MTDFDVINKGVCRIFYRSGLLGFQRLKMKIVVLKPILQHRDHNKTIFFRKW